MRLSAARRGCESCAVPELIRGMCCICFGTLTPETTFHDCVVGTWDFHKGKCALLAGETGEIGELEAIHLGTLAKRVRTATNNTPEYKAAIREYYAYVDSVAAEDHSDVEQVKR